MSLKDNKVTLLNYNPFIVSVPTETRTYMLDPCYDYDVPTLVNVSFSDVEYVNSRSNAFRTGLLFFKSEQQEELYKELSIFDWKNIITNKEIENILMNPTMEGLQKILDIKDESTFERVYCILVHLENSNVDLSNRVIKVIDARQKEFKRGTFKTEIVLQERITKPVDTTEDVSNLKEQLAEMKKMMAELVAKQSITNDKPKVEVAEDKSVKKAGRPPKTTK